MMRKNCFAASVSIALVAVLAGFMCFACIAEAAPKYKLGMAMKMGPQSPEYKGFERFCELVAEKSGGEIEISIFGNEVLGNDEAVFKSMQMGAVDIVADSPMLGAKMHAPKLEYLTPPFVYDDFEHFQRFLRSDYVMNIYKDLEEKAGVAILNTEWTWKRGPYRVISSKSPVRTPDDLKGMKLRFYPSEFEQGVWRYMGANPIVIAFAETYLALQQGMVDSVTSPVTVILDTKFVEVCKYVTRTDEFPQTFGVFMNKKKLDSLPAEMQKVLSDACNEAGVEYSANIDRTAGDLIEACKAEYGITYSAVDMKSFIEKAGEHYAEMERAGKMDADLKEVMEAIEKAR